MTKAAVLGALTLYTNIAPGYSQTKGTIDIVQQISVWRPLTGAHGTRSTVYFKRYDCLEMLVFF